MNMLSNLYRGRIDRGQFVGGLMVNFLISIFGSILSFGFIAMLPSNTEPFSFTLTGTIFFLLFCLGPILLILTILIQISLIVRRLHDMGDSGFFAIIVLALPFLIFWLIFSAGEPATNEYGKKPSEVGLSNISSILFNTRIKI